MESPPVVSEFENLSEGDKTVSTKFPEPFERDQSFTVYRTSLSDQATVNDALGFTPYVTAIAEFLLNPDTEPPLTLSIEGEWGSGKSSFMKQLDKYLREKGQRTVWFNAWRHDKAEAVWATFALSFIKQISTPQTLTWEEYKKKNEEENKKASLRTYRVDILKANYHIVRGHVKLARSRFDLKKGWLELLQAVGIFLFVLCAAIAIPFILLIYGWQGLTQLIGALKNPDQIVQAVFYVLGIAGGSSLSLAGLSALLKKLPGMIGSPKLNLIKYLKSPDYTKQSAFIEEFHEDFSKIVDAYIGDGKVFVFIDDLDRCEHPKAADLMQAINLMIAEDPSVVFILGMDREKVAASLAVKYEQVLTYLPSEAQEIDPEILVQRKLDKGLAYGYSFIEKFVQLPFQVPQPSLTDFAHLFEQLTKRKSQSDSTKNTSAKKSFWTLPKFTWLKGKNQDLQNSQIPEMIEQATNPTAITQQLVQTEATLLTTQIQKRLETIKVIFDQDSSTERDAIRMVAPLFDYNPRRIKQFLNLFRLKFYIAYLTGLFDRIEEGEGNVSQEPLTVFQLAKFTAISLKYPLFLLDLKNDYNLLKRIHYSFEHFPTKCQSEMDDIPKENDCSKKWKGSYPKLAKLIIDGCWSEFDIPVSILNDDFLTVNPQFSLAKLKVEMLLKISPQVIRQNQALVAENTSSLLTPDLQVVIDQILGQMVEIPGGSFLMGTDEAEVQRLNRTYSTDVYNRELPQHQVTLQKYFLGKYPVTQEQYQAIMGNNPSRFKDNPKNPVEQVSWQDAQAFCQKLKELTGQDFRLPTEAEWEYACRAIPPTPLNKGGGSSRYYFGDDESQLGDYAWYDENSDSKTHSVGHKKPNDWGLYDMSGNVWEWCEDSWHDSYANKPENIKNNGSIIWSDSNESYRVLRGGSWLNNSRDCRSANRDRDGAGYWNGNIGFRLVLSSF